MAKSWPLGRSAGFYDWNEIVAPFELYLVSVKPDVVIMVPNDSEENYGSHISGWGSKDKDAESVVVNRIAVATSLPAHPDLLWFSHDLDVEPTPVLNNEILLGDERLVLERDKDIVRVVRGQR